LPQTFRNERDFQKERVVRALTISDLERESGIRRGAIHFYLSEGLLPPAQKVSATRSLYTDEHVELLRQIAVLKGEGLSLDQIRQRLAERIDEAGATDVDLAADQVARRRTAILEEAARQFAEKGYRRTRIADIVRALGITPPQLYSLFPSKYHLFVSCYNVFFRWMETQVEPEVAEQSDPAVRLAWRLHADLGIYALSPELLAFVQAESAVPESGELRELIRSTFESVHTYAVKDLAGTRREGTTPTFLRDELISYGLQGAFDRMLMRVSWDDEYTKLDAMESIMAMYLAIEAVYEGRTDITARYTGVQGLLERLHERRPPGPPERDTSNRKA
jgi:AcrR family transcriptional regulator